MGIGLYPFKNVESVPGIIKDFFPGISYGKKKPTIRELKNLINYLDRLHKEDFTFYDGVCLDFISSKSGTALVDCSSLMDKSECSSKFENNFEYVSKSYKNRIIYDLNCELYQNNFLSLNFDFRYCLAKWLSSKK